MLVYLYYYFFLYVWNKEKFSFRRWMGFKLIKNRFKFKWNYEKKVSIWWFVYICIFDNINNNILL